MIASRHVVLLCPASILSLAGTFRRCLSFSVNSGGIPANGGFLRIFTAKDATGAKPQPTPKQPQRPQKEHEGKQISPQENRFRAICEGKVVSSLRLNFAAVSRFKEKETKLADG